MKLPEFLNDRRPSRGLTKDEAMDWLNVQSCHIADKHAASDDLDPQPDERAEDGIDFGVDENGFF